MQIVILALAGLFLVTSAQSVSAAGRVFYDGFESGSFGSGWADGYADGPGIIPPAGNKGHDNLVLPIAGQRQMECRYGTANTDTWFCKYIPINALYRDEIFIRLWIRLDQDVQSNQGSMAHLIRFYSGGGGATDILTSMIGDGAGSAQIIADALWNNVRPSGSPKYYSFSPGLGDRKWHKYELYLNNVTHVYKMWQDDVLKISLSDATINAHLPAFIPLHNWGSPKPTDNNTHVYFDEVEVFSDLGTGGSGSMANGDITQGGSTSTTAPPAPTNLRVQ
jgi:hypothetical protein